MLTVAVMGAGLWVMADASTLIATLVAMTLLSTAHSIFSPVSTALVSRYAQPTERGMLLGLFQGVGSLGRVLGPAYAGAMFVQLGVGAPYLIGAVLMVPCLMLAVQVVRRPSGGVSKKMPEGKIIPTASLKKKQTLCFLTHSTDADPPRDRHQCRTVRPARSGAYVRTGTYWAGNTSASRTPRSSRHSLSV